MLLATSVTLATFVTPELATSFRRKSSKYDLVDTHENAVFAINYTNGREERVPSSGIATQLGRLRRGHCTDGMIVERSEQPQAELEFPNAED
jgi:hypothetical protein